MRENGRLTDVSSPGATSVRTTFSAPGRIALMNRRPDRSGSRPGGRGRGLVAALLLVLLTASLILLTAFVAPSAAANERASGVVSPDRSGGLADVSEATRPFGASGAGYDLGDGGAVRAVANQSDPGPG